MERDSFLSSHSFLIFFSHLWVLRPLSQLKKKPHTSFGSITQTLVCFSDLVLSSSSLLLRATMASVMGIALPSCLSPSSEPSSPHPSIVCAEPTLVNASMILNFLLLKSETLHWFLQIVGLFSSGSDVLLPPAFSETSVPYLETLSRSFLQNSMQWQAPYPHVKAYSQCIRVGRGEVT